MKRKFFNAIKLLHFPLILMCPMYDVWILNKYFMTGSQWRLKIRGNYFCSLCLLSFSFPLLLPSLVVLFVYFLPSIIIYFSFYFLSSFLSFKTHYISDVSSIIMRFYIHFHIYITHIMPPTICIVIKVSFAIGIMGTFSPLKA
jgi:hypothetical protein